MGLGSRGESPNNAFTGGPAVLLISKFAHHQKSTEEDEMSAFDGTENDREVWRQTKENIWWSMTNSGANSEGQQKMIHATRQATEDYMGEFKEGFELCQDGPSVLAMFKYCCQKAQREVYNHGRSVMGWPPI